MYIKNVILLVLCLSILNVCKKNQLISFFNITKMAPSSSRYILYCYNS